jgi:hypothetical protein
MCLSFFNYKPISSVSKLKTLALVTGLIFNDFKIFAITDLGLNVLKLMNSYNASASLCYSKLTGLEAFDRPATISEKICPRTCRNRAKVLQTLASVLTKLSLITSLMNTVYNKQSSLRFQQFQQFRIQQKFSQHKATEWWAVYTIAD